MGRELDRQLGREDREGEVQYLRGEVERLQREWASLYGVERMRFAAVQRMTAEIEHLRAVVAAMRKETDLDGVRVIGQRALTRHATD